jgi:hypothetical protein
MAGLSGGGGGEAVDLDHVVFPLDPVGRALAVAVVAVVVVASSLPPVILDRGGIVGCRRLGDRRGREQLHPTLWTAPRLVAHHFGMHGAGVGDRARAGRHGGRVVHLGDQSQDLVGWGSQPPIQLLALGLQLRSPAQHLELLRQRPLGPFLCHLQPGQTIGPVRGVVLQVKLAGLVGQHVDHRPLRGGQQHLVDELLVLDAAAVAADQLQSRPGHGHVEHPAVGGVGQPQPHHLPRPGRQAQICVATGQEDVAVAAHGRVAGLDWAEGRHLAVLQQQVVQGQHDLAVGRRPVAGVGRDDQDVAVQAELLGVVLPDVGVVPVQAGVGELDAIGEAAADRDGRLGLVGDTVVAVLQPQPVPVDGRVQVAPVLDLHDDL